LTSVFLRAPWTAGRTPSAGRWSRRPKISRVCIAAIEADGEGGASGAYSETVSLLLRVARRLEAVSGEMHRLAKASEVPS